MSRQNFYKQRKVRRMQQIDEKAVLNLVRRERRRQPRLGTRKLYYLLKQEFASAGIKVGRDRLFALLGRNKMLIKKRSRCPRTTDSRHRFRVYGNVLKDVTLIRAGQAVVSDITYIRTDEGFLYLSLMMDAYSRAVVGYAASDSLEAEGALKALKMAMRNLPSCSGIIHHSDRGCQYCSRMYIDVLMRKGFKVSMTEENHCYENGKAERLNGILKQEYGLGGRFRNKRDAYKAIKEAVILYNNYRPHQALGYRFPTAVHKAA